MKTIRVKKGYTPKVVGSPSTALQKTEQPTRLALVPEQIPFVKLRLNVKKGDHVALGSPLVEDKRNTDIQLLSPGGGRVADVRFGPRRVIQEIIIQLDETEKIIEFQRYSQEDIDKMSREELVQALVTGGVWPLIKELPFRDYPRPDFVPPFLFVSLGSLEPFHPAPQVYLPGNEDLFDFGLSVLNKLAKGRLYVCNHRADTELASSLNGLINLTYTGNYPAHDPGVLLYRMKSSPEENRSWFIDGQDVVLIARLLRNGVYPTERIVSLGGSGARQPKHLITRMGAPLSVIADDRTENEKWRYIQGGILTGYGALARSHLGFSESALNLLPEGNRKGELLGLFNPGYRKPTFSRAFLSALNREELMMDCKMNGGERACIACGYCALVCPVDILPQFTYKAILAGEVEESLEHGLLDCVECALCSYVCPSKIELFETLKNAKAEFYKEKEQDH
ncbi:MAG: 4Fe-4S dicluster domain-containing protein [Desulfobacterales bacterium]|jgi:Na+-transporting NADH:ubiquinone oxidoreductase subunit A